ncbi:MAG: nucleoside deaminase, partial [Kiritimatiellaeota bacterium]|nr:nucleoside deaminase [Kiritimatiellota bacterium]
MHSLDIHKRFMREALREAVKAADTGEVPTGCVIVRTDKKVRGQGDKGYASKPEPLNPLTPESLNPLTPESLNSLTPESLNPLTPQIIARAHNQTELLKDATAHAEILAITQASAATGDWRLTDTILYVTKEPCAMCAGA